MISTRLAAFFVTALVVGSLGALGPRSAHAEPVLNARIPFMDTLVNPCTGTLVTVTGEMHVVGHRVPKNTTHAGASLSIHGTGVDAAGNRYRLIEQGSTGLNANFPLVEGETVTSGVGEAKVVATVIFVSQGSAPNMVSHAVMHVVAHFDTGIATGTVDFTRAECRG